MGPAMLHTAKWELATPHPALARCLLARLPTGPPPPRPPGKAPATVSPGESAPFPCFQCRNKRGKGNAGRTPPAVERAAAKVKPARELLEPQAGPRYSQPGSSFEPQAGPRETSQGAPLSRRQGQGKTSQGAPLRWSRHRGNGCLRPSLALPASRPHAQQRAQHASARVSAAMRTESRESNVCRGLRLSPRLARLPLCALPCPADKIMLCGVVEVRDGWLLDVHVPAVPRALREAGVQPELAVEVVPAHPWCGTSHRLRVQVRRTG